MPVILPQNVLHLCKVGGKLKHFNFSTHQCSVFQAEVVAIQAAAGIIGDRRVSNRNYIILSDSQAAIKALSFNVTDSKTIYGCR